MGREAAGGGGSALSDGGSSAILTSLVSSDSGPVEGSQLKRTLTSHSQGGYSQGDNNSPDTPDHTALPSAEEIVERRGALKWLPEHGSSSDIEHAMVWFTAASLLAAVIPIVPMATYDEMNEYGVHNHSIGYQIHTMTYVLLILCGLFYTLGSYALKRAVQIPSRKPLMPCIYHTSTDELLGSWCFLIGTLVTLPICIVLLSYDPVQSSYWLGLVFITLACIICAVFCHSCYPSQQRNAREILHPLLINCGPYCCSSAMEMHLANDLLICAWAFFVTSAVVTILCLLLFFYAVAETDENMLFDYGLSFLDMALFTVGSAYFVAGAYPAPSKGSPADRYPRDSATTEL
jgi:hypothetical protein